MENGAFAPFSIIFSNKIFQRRQKVLLWSKVLRQLSEYLKNKKI